MCFPKLSILQDSRQFNFLLIKGQIRKGEEGMKKLTIIGVIESIGVNSTQELLVKA